MVAPLPHRRRWDRLPAYRDGEGCGSSWRGPIEAGGVVDAADNKPLRDFLLGFVEVHVLYRASREPIYGVWFLEELARHGYHLSPGTLYPLLHDLEESGYLRREDRVVDGKVRTYYRITPAGRKVLREARDKIRELVDEIMDDDGERTTAAR